MPRQHQPAYEDKARTVLRGALLNILTNSPMLLGFLIILGSRGPLTRGRLGLGLLVAGITGFMIVVRREVPFSIGTIRGKWAVGQGIALTVVLWVGALYVFIFGST